MCVFVFQGGGRVVTTDPQQKPTKTITARVTARTAVGKTSRHNLQVTGAPPPNSSVIVERHYAAPQVCIVRLQLRWVFFFFLEERNLKHLKRSRSFRPFIQPSACQATVSKFQRSSQQGRSSSAGRSSSRMHSSTCNAHSIKVVD